MIEVIRGDITKIQADAIVNAANTSLLGGSGVDGAIHRAGGKTVLEECQKIRNKQGGCKIGQAVITTAGKLSAKYIIHTVGPVWHNGENNEEELLSLAYTNCIKLAINYQIKTIAFPNISTGIYHFPKIKAAQIAIKTITELIKNTDMIEKIIFVCYDIENYNIYKQILTNRVT